MQNKHLLWSDKQTITTLKTVLDNGNVAITATDTVPGFLAPITGKGFEMLNHLKGSRQKKPYLILIANAQKLTYFVDPNNANSIITKLIEQCWPGPLTLVFKARKDLDVYLKSAENTIAVRCPKHAGLQTLLRQFDGLFSTSANVSGAPAPRVINDVSATLLNASACVVDDDTVGEASHQPSTILDVSTCKKEEAEGCVKLLRAGSIPVDVIESIINQKIIR